MPPKTLSARKRIDVVLPHQLSTFRHGKTFQKCGDTYYRINRIARLCKTFQVCGDAYFTAYTNALKM
jgi:hypothetical protein